MKKPWGIILLIIFFLWTLSRDVISLFPWADSVDRAVFAGNGLTLLFFVLVIGAILIETTAVFFLFKRARIGFFVALAALLWSVLQNTVVTVLALSNLDTAKQSFIASRTARGLPVQPEAYDLMFTPVGMLAVLALAVMVNAFVALLLFLKRKYFFSDRAASNS